MSHRLIGPCQGACNLLGCPCFMADFTPQSKQTKGILQRVGEGLDNILTLSDLETEQMVQTPDRLSVAGASYFTSVDQSSVHASEVGSYQKERLLTSVDVPGSKKTQGEKFFLIHTAEWTTAHGNLTEVAKLDVVKLLYDQQFSVDGFLRYHTYGRFGVEVQVQINPTSFQQGGLICAMVPADQGYGSITCLPIYPHGLLNCNINNVVRIKVPFIYTRGAYNFRDPQYPVWELTIRVWSPLQIGTGTTPYTSLNVLARLTDLELHGLTPIMAHMMRNETRISTSQNIMNLANYEDARAKISLALDQESWLEDSSEAGGLAITNFSTWTSVPTLAATFDFSASSTVGTQIKVIPVDPYFYQIKTESPAQNCVTALASVAQMFCFWRGDIVFDFQIFPTKYHSGRLLFCFVPGNEKMDVSKITIKQATTAPCAVMDITGVQSTLRFRVPWISDTPYRVNRYTKASHVKGEYTAIGKLIVFVYNRLSAPSNVAPHVKVNVFMSAVNLELFAPLYNAQGVDATAQAGGDSEEEDGGFGSNVSTAQNVPDPTGGITTSKQLKGSANKGKMDLAVGKVPTGVVTTIEDPVLAKKTPETFPEQKPGKSRHTSDHMSIYKYMGRSHFLNTFTFTSNNTQYTFPISLSSTLNPPHGLPSTLRWFFTMFHLYRGPLDLSINIAGATDVDGLIWFTPVGVAADPNWSEAASKLSVDYKTALGALRFNTRRTGNIQLRLPWYTYLYAISGALDGFGDQSDSTFGTVSIQIGNYTHSDEYLAFSVYMSVTPESQFLFPRAPLNNAVMHESDGRSVVRKRREAGDLESAVDDPRTPEDIRFEEEISNEILPIEQVPSNTALGKLYKDLRMDTGKMRLKYAKEEWDDMMKQRDKYKKKFMAHSIGQFQDFAIVTRKDGNKIIKGFVFGKDVWTFNDFNIVTRNVSVKVKIFQKYVCSGIKSLDALDWEEVPVHQNVGRFLQKLTSLPNWQDARLSYEALDSCSDSITSEAVLSAHGDPVWKEFPLDVFKAFLKCMKPVKTGLVDRLGDALGIKPHATKFSEEFSTLSEEIVEFIRSIRASIVNFSYQFFEKKWTFILQFLLKMVRIGLFTYLCEKVSYDPAVVLPVVAVELIDSGLDFIDAFRWFSFILRESFENKISERLLDLQDDDLQAHAGFSQILRDAVSGTILFKNAKDCICWIITKFKEWYDEHHGPRSERIKLLLEYQDKINNVMAGVDVFCVKPIQDVEKDSQFEFGMRLLKCLRTTQALVADIPEMKKHAQPISDAITKVHMKLKSFGAINQNMSIRAEPYVCFMYGTRGGGKSLCSMALAVKICKAMGVDPSKNIYTKPIGSDYWDGYANQLVCVIDDIGQCTDDSDWNSFCQLVSGCPLRLNMAAIEEKGKHFTSPFIICTSNQDDPSPKTVYVKEAISRRLHLRVQVIPKQYFSTPNGMLNVELAKKEDVIRTMECVSLTIEGRETTIMELVDIMTSRVRTRKQNMDEFMNLWAQGDKPMKWNACDDSIEEIDGWKSEFDNLCNFPSFGASGQYLRKFFSKLTGNKWWIMGSALGVGAVLVTCWGGWKWYKNRKEKKEKEKHDKSVYDSSGVYSGITKPKHVVKLDKLPPQDAQSVVEISGLIHKNLVKFGIGKKGECINWVVNGLGIKDDYVLVPSHAFSFDNHVPDLEFYFERDPTFYSVNSGSVEIYNLDVGFQDVVLMRVPNMPKFRDITAHFIKKQDMQKVVGKLATLCTNYRGIFQLVSEGPVKLDTHATYGYKDEEGDGHEITISEAWRGKGQSAPGMCGGALVSSDQKLQNPIIGIHVAGGHGNMISKAIWREMFDVIDKKVATAQRIRKVEFVQTRLNLGTKTLFKKSPVYDLIPANSINFPAALPYQKKNEIDPVQMMLSKYDVPICVKPDGWDECVSAYVYSATQGYSQTARLTVYEAIEGVFGMDKINMKSSAGIPYTSMGLDKEDLISMSDEGLVEQLHPFLMSRLDINWMLLDNGNQLDVVYATSAKDELRPMEKVLSSKTRAIEACPLDFTIIVRVMWGSAISFFQTTPSFTTGIAVGMDPDSDWDSLFKAMKRIGDYGLDLDFTNFDASLSPFMIETAVKILNRMCGNSEMHDVALTNAIAYSRHQILDMVYTVEGSMPSGTPCTSLLNSLINNCCLTYVFSRVLGIDPYDVGEVMKWITYGDDVLIVFNREIKKDFSVILPYVVDAFKELGMTVTSSSKGLPQICKIEELSFLKRKFYFEDGRFRPSISETTIWSILAWQRSNADFIENVKTACWFAFLKGSTFYDKFVTKLEMMLRMANVSVILPTYSVLLARFKDLDFERDMD